jgi:hypothetical protein
MSSVLLGLLLAPSLLLPQPLPRGAVLSRCSHSRCHLALSEESTDAATSNAAVAEAPPAAPAPPAAEPTAEERVLSMASSWITDDADARRKTMDELSKLANDFDVGIDPSAIKEQLIGSWKLIAAADNDRICTEGLSGHAQKSYARVQVHFQTYSKPDPMDIFSGSVDEKFFMRSIEVVSNAKEGTSSTVEIKGGFQILPVSDGELGIVEYYTHTEVNNVPPTAAADVAPNKWSCAFVSPTVRVCKMPNGSSRVYQKVEASAVAEELVRIRAVEVEIDPEAAAEDEAVEEDEDEDDPDDNRPLWQKRIDKADGIKRTKNGTPIINHGPIGGGGGPPISKG